MRPPKRRRRRVKSGILLGLCAAAVIVMLLPLASILYECFVNGAGAINPDFFLKNPPPPCNPGVGTVCPTGGVQDAIVGTLLLVALASLIALPIGILGGIYLSEFEDRPLARPARFLADVMTGIPSIVIGVFVFGIFYFFAQEGWITSFSIISGYTGAVALAVIMIPVVARTSEEALRLVPTSIREASLALGIPRHRTILRIVLSAGRGGVITGSLLAVARAGGETAPLLLTVGFTTGTITGLSGWTPALPVLIYQFASAQYPNWTALAWGSALILVLMMLLISVGARVALRNRFGGRVG
ncbi:MAG TPA: phosphate ABC transporter permease PstA [Thermoplasmata archaeon]|jgi:phosphate transport system permease protein|nr:phosphate ABC transporter permease PstA [Thermoplasmata archaeon]